MILTQSSIKDFKDCCPRRWYDVWVAGNKFASNDDMLRGQYFETLCLGKAADGSQVTDLRRLANGDKSADHLRIEKQAVRFTELFDPQHRDYLGNPIATKQLELRHGIYKGTLDFTTAPAIWDLKLTKDLDGYWATPSTIDMLQPVFYTYLYEEIYGVRLGFNFLIFEYSPKLRVKQIKVNITSTAIEAALARFDTVQLAVEQYEQADEFPRIPSGEQCRKCMLDCSVRALQPIIQYEEITV